MVQPDANGSSFLRRVDNLSYRNKTFVKIPLQLKSVQRKIPKSMNCLERNQVQWKQDS